MLSPILEPGNESRSQTQDFDDWGRSHVKPSEKEKKRQTLSRVKSLSLVRMETPVRIVVLGGRRVGKSGESRLSILSPLLWPVLCLRADIIDARTLWLFVCLEGRKRERVKVVMESERGCDFPVVSMAGVNSFASSSVILFSSRLSSSRDPRA